MTLSIAQQHRLARASKIVDAAAAETDPAVRVRMLVKVMQEVWAVYLDLAPKPKPESDPCPAI